MAGNETLQSGDRVGAFVVRGILDPSETPPTYLAEHTETRQLAALHVLPATERALPGAVTRFFAEAHALRAIGHPNVPAILDLEEAGDPFFVAVELLRGRPLAELMSGRPLRLPRALHLGHQMASALDAAHRNGVVHGHLTPTCVFVVTRGGDPNVVKVLELGAQHGTPLSLLGGSSVDATYGAPEQFHQAATVDHRTDIYAFGVILFELCAGRPPFLGTSPHELAHQHVNATPPAPSEVARIAIPDPVDRLVRACLEKQQDHRPSSMAEVLHALEDIVARMGKYVTQADDAPAATSMRAMRGMSAPKASVIPLPSHPYDVPTTVASPRAASRSAPSPGRGSADDPTRQDLDNVGDALALAVTTAFDARLAAPGGALPDLTGEWRLDRDLPSAKSVGSVPKVAGSLSDFAAAATVMVPGGTASAPRVEGVASITREIGETTPETNVSIPVVPRIGHESATAAATRVPVEHPKAPPRTNRRDHLGAAIALGIGAVFAVTLVLAMMVLQAGEEPAPSPRPTSPHTTRSPDSPPGVPDVVPPANNGATALAAQQPPTPDGEALAVVAVPPAAPNETPSLAPNDTARGTPNDTPPSAPQEKQNHTPASSTPDPLPTGDTVAPPPDKVRVTFSSTPTGAGVFVSHSASTKPVCITPCEHAFPRQARPMSVTFRLKGARDTARTFEVVEGARVEVVLKERPARPRPQQPRKTPASTSELINPF